MDPEFGRLLVGLAITLLCWAATAGGIVVMVRRNTGDIRQVDDERKACREQMDGRVAHTMEKVDGRLGKVETGLTAVSTKLDTLIELNGGRKK